MRTMTWWVVFIVCMGQTLNTWGDETLITEDNIVFGEGGTEALKLDLARPTGEGPFPALIILHGGGWGLGKRKDFRQWTHDAAKRGYVAVTADYRLAIEDKDGKIAFQFPAQVHDAKCAVRWMRANAAEYKIDPDRIGAVGSSAGGQLALMLGLTKPSHNFDGNGGNAQQSSSVRAVAHWAGPADMTGFYHGTNAIVVPFVVRYLGGTPEQVPEVYKASSPLSYVTDQAPPILTIHGEIDDAVPIQGSKMMDQAMKAVGAEHELLILQGQGHSYDPESMRLGTEGMYKFLDKHLKAKR